MEELKEYELFLNSLIPGIKVTLSASTESVDFLDTTVYKDTTSIDSDTLLTRVFFKDTDTHQLLHTRSYHPKHTTKGILKSQLLRFKRISSNYTDYNNVCNILFKVLSTRGYAKSLLRKAKRDVWQLDESINIDNDSKKQMLPIVILYNNINTNLASQWKSILMRHDKFKEFKLITAYCNSENLRKHLICSSITRPITMEPAVATRDNISGSYRCTSNRCKACSYIIESNTFKSSKNNRSFAIKYKLGCKSSNIIYLIICKKCNLQYVGETGRPFSERINNHLSCIRTKKMSSPIGLHFNHADHTIHDFSIMAIEQFRNNQHCTKERQSKEKTWQNILQTAHPFGLNKCNTDEYRYYFPLVRVMWIYIYIYVCVRQSV